MIFKTNGVCIALMLTLIFSCKTENQRDKPQTKIKTETVKKQVPHELQVDKPAGTSTPEGMVWVKGKTLLQGAKKGDTYAMMREKPAHQVRVDGFFIDITEVTNAEFKEFVIATGYVTVAERPIDWDTMKKELPPDTPKPADSVLQPGSLIFNKNVNAIANMENYGQWWTWKIGANWKQPEGPDSSIVEKENYPVVHVAFEDAQAYCRWANRRLPTEAEWEAAAQGGNDNTIFTWGNNAEQLVKNANTWQGTFPVKNESVDSFELIAPVTSYLPNSIGIYDMLGNVWEMTADKFNRNYYRDIDTTTTLINPKGAEDYNSSQNPYQKEIVIKGGSFLCHASYCASFRISARMGMALDSGSDHVGFRTVATPKMINTPNPL